jgi:hypothetical protein
LLVRSVFTHHGAVRLASSGHVGGVR